MVNGPAIYDSAAQLPDRYQRYNQDLALGRVCQRRYYTAKLDGDLHVPRGSIPNANGYRDSDGNSHSDGYANRDSNSYAYANSYSYGNGNGYSNSNSNSNCYSNGDRDRTATAYTGATASTLADGTVIG
jgi:hypothetical protein